MHWRRTWQPTPVFLPGESQGRGSLVGCHPWGRIELDTTEATLQQQQQQILKLPPGGRSYLYAAHQHVDFRPVGTRRLMMLSPTNLTTNPSEKCPQADHSLIIKLLATPSSFESISLLWPPLLDKAIMLFFT